MHSLICWYVLKMSWRWLEDVFAGCLEDVLRTYHQNEYINLDQYVFRMSSENEDKDFFKMSSARPWNYSTSRINMQENCFIKACLVQHIFEVERDSLQTKKQKCLSLPDHQLAENMILDFGFYEKTNKE